VTPAVVIATVNREHGSTGVHTHTRALRDGLIAAGVGCEVVTPFDGSLAWVPVFAVRPLVLNHLNRTWATLWYRHWHGAAVRANLRDRLASGRVDRIVAQCPVSAAAAMDVAGGVPVTMVCHFNHSEAAEYRDQGCLAGEARYRRMLAVEDDVLRRVDRVVYVSEWAKDIVERDRGVTPRASAVIRNGIAERASGPAVSRREIGLSADDVVLMSVGTLEHRKNQVALVEMLANLTEPGRAGPDRGDTPRLCKLVLVGEGPDRSKIERRIRELNLTDRVVLLGHRSDVAALLPLADVYVHAALAENCPVSVIEAARAGLPWAAVPAAGMVELQRHLGGCVSLDGPDALRPLLADPTLRAELGRIAAANFIAGFTRTAMVRAYMDALGITPRTDLEPRAEVLGRIGSFADPGPAAARSPS
jgi:glycosyltransferase involved in cell wall biosynthesis